MSMPQSWHGRRWRASGWNWMGLEINGKRGGEEERDKKGKRRGHTMTLTNCGDLVSKVSSLCQSMTLHTGFCISPINSKALPCTLTCCISDSMYWTPQTVQCCTAPCICAPTCAASLFICLFVYLCSLASCVACLVCLFPLLDCFCC